LKQAHREIAQVFQAIAMEHHESWLKCGGHEQLESWVGEAAWNYQLSQGSWGELGYKKRFNTL
jgi:hypothetical protein